MRLATADGSASVAVREPLFACYTKPVPASLVNLREVFLKHGPAVYRRAKRILGNHADAEEATQEVFIRAIRGAEAFKGDCQVTTWLYRLTTNYCLNLIRDSQRRRELLEEFGGGQGSETGRPPGDLLLLRQLLVDADEEQARAAIYVFVDGMSHAEAAEVMGVSRRTVGNLVQRFQERARARQAGGTGVAEKVAETVAKKGKKA